MARPLSTEEFAAECNRRLLDTFDVSVLLGLRSRDAVWNRVRAGKLAPPIVQRANHLSLWDRDTIPDSERRGDGS